MYCVRAVADLSPAAAFSHLPSPGHIASLAWQSTFQLSRIDVEMCNPPIDTTPRPGETVFPNQPHGSQRHPQG
jgi:hypothetical protein